VLLAEDNPINQVVARELLESAGLVVDLAGTGRAAIALARGARYDVILMDVQMPDEDGLAATRAIRGLPAHAATPIIAFTANALAEERAACIAAGMNDHVAKPVEPEALFATLSRWLAPAAAARAGDAGVPPAAAGPAGVPGASDAIALDTPQAQAQLAQLEALLEAGDFAAAAAGRDVAALIRAMADDQGRAFELHLRNYDYAPALAALRELRRKARERAAPAQPA